MEWKLRKQTNESIGLKVFPQLPPVTGSQCPPDVQVDLLAGKADAAVTTSDVNAAGVIAACGKDAPAARLDVRDLAGRPVVVRIAGPVLPAVDPAGAAVSRPATEKRTGTRVRFQPRRVSGQDVVAKSCRARTTRSIDEVAADVHHRANSQGIVQRFVGDLSRNAQ